MIFLFDVQLDAVRILLLYGADVDAQCPPRFDRRRAIHFAALIGSVELTRMLLEAGASTGLAPDYSITPLNCAIQHDQPDVCRALLEYGADPNEINGDGCSALQVRSRNLHRHCSRSQNLIQTSPVSQLRKPQELFIA